MTSREERIEDYAEEYFASELAEWLVDAEDEIEMWKTKVDQLATLLEDESLTAREANSAIYGVLKEGAE